MWFRVVVLFVCNQFNFKKYIRKNKLLADFSLHILMSVVILMIEEVEDKLTALQNCLSSLSNFLSYFNQFYNFTCFVLNSKEVEDFELNDVVNYALKVTFCSINHQHNLSFLKHELNLVTVVDVLRKFNTEFSSHAALQKWIDDLLKVRIKLGGSMRHICNW